MAERLEIEDPNPQAIFELVEQLIAIAPSLSPSASSVVNLNVGSDSSAILDSQSINQLTTSIRLLSEALVVKYKRPSQTSVSASHRPSSREVATVSDNLKQSSKNSSAGVDRDRSWPTEPIESSQPNRSNASGSSKTSKEESSSRSVSQRSIEAETEVNKMREFEGAIIPPP